MTEFKKGDKVRLEQVSAWGDPRWIGTEGTVEEHTSSSYSLASVRLTKPVVPGYRVGQLIKLSKANLTLLKDEQKVEVGDRVTVKGYSTDPASPWEGRSGVVRSADTFCAVVNFDNDGRMFSSGGFEYKFLVKDKEFTYADIQKGDKIRRTITRTDGTVSTTEGVADYQSFGDWYSKDGYSLASKSTTLRDGTQKLELLKRVEKKEPEIWENRKTGDKIVRDSNGAKTVFTKLSNGRWESLYLDSNGPRLGTSFEDSEFPCLLSGAKKTLVTAR